MTYTVRSMFHTVQGEGYHAGRGALFVRFSGCNLWSGVPENRAKDALRTGARCPNWCDTEFRGCSSSGGKYDSAQALADKVWCELQLGRERLVVITGGEPLLQVDQRLADALLTVGKDVLFAVETNGTVALPFTAWRERWWLTMAPKLPRAQTLLQGCDEIKLVYPGYDPAEWADFPARHRWIQPLDLVPSEGAIGEVSNRLNTRACVEYVAAHPEWRLGLQSHKVWGVE